MSHAERVKSVSRLRKTQKRSRHLAIGRSADPNDWSLVASRRRQTTDSRWSSSRLSARLSTCRSAAALGSRVEWRFVVEYSATDLVHPSVLPEISPRVASVWICIPTYNEAENVVGHLTAVLDVIDSALIDAHVLVIDDNSSDGTGRLAARLAAHEPRLTVLHRPRKGGIGPAYRAGFEVALAAGADVIVEMDCDGSHDPRELPHLLEALEYADLALGSRYVRGGRVERWGLGRRAISQGGCWYARTALGVPVRDLTGGYKAFRRNVVEHCVADVAGASGYGFQVETTIEALRQGFRVAEVPITFRDRMHGRSKMSLRVAVEAFVLVARLRLRTTDRDDWLQLARYCVVGVSGYAINLVVFALLATAAGVAPLSAAIAAFAVAVSVNFACNKLWTFRRHRRPALVQGARYLQVSAVGLAFNLAILAALLALGVGALFAQLVSVAAIAPMSFLVNRRWSF